MKVAASLITLALVGGLMQSCITVKKAKERAYDYMLTDTFRDNAERAKLSRGYFSEFPFYKDTPMVRQVMDSSAYNDFIANQNMLLDQVINAYEIIDSLNALPRIDTATGAKIIPPPKAKPNPGDSARFVRNYLNGLKGKIPPVQNSTEKVTPIMTDGKLTEANKALNDCRYELQKAYTDKETAETKLQRKNANMGWFYGGGLLLALIAFGVGRITRKV